MDRSAATPSEAKHSLQTISRQPILQPNPDKPILSRPLHTPWFLLAVVFGLAAFFLLGTGTYLGLTTQQPVVSVHSLSPTPTIKPSDSQRQANLTVSPLDPQLTWQPLRSSSLNQLYFDNQELISNPRLNIIGTYTLSGKSWESILTADDKTEQAIENWYDTTFKKNGWDKQITVNNINLLALDGQGEGSNVTGYIGRNGNTIRVVNISLQQVGMNLTAPTPTPLPSNIPTPAPSWKISYIIFLSDPIQLSDIMSQVAKTLTLNQELSLTPSPSPTVTFMPAVSPTTFPSVIPTVRISCPPNPPCTSGKMCPDHVVYPCPLQE